MSGRRSFRRVAGLLLAAGLGLAGCGRSADEDCLADVAARGARMTPWTEAPTRGSCGVDTPITLLAGRYELLPPVGTSCRMASAWLKMEPTIDHLARRELGVPVAAVTHYGSYGCRRVNNSWFGRKSLHATARALDVSGFVLADGQRIEVARDWRSRGSKGRFLRAVAKAACERFSVVLTPESDRHHQDHLHFDIGPWRHCGL